MEIIFKIIGTCIVTWIYVASLYWLWTQQIDIKESAFRASQFLTLQKNEWIATRDPMAIYQNSKIVGNICGAVTREANTVIFQEIYNTASLNKALPFEYKKEKLKIIRIGTVISVSSIASNYGTEVKNNVIKDVVCERAK